MGSQSVCPPSQGDVVDGRQVGVWTAKVFDGMGWLQFEGQLSADGTWSGVLQRASSGTIRTHSVTAGKLGPVEHVVDIPRE